MKYKFILIIILFFSIKTYSQHPKLVVGIVIDQMRWDFLYRYSQQYNDSGGFKQILKRGFSCNNTYIPYIPSITACGHASIYTGSTPSLHGIVANEWFDRKKRKEVSSVEDSFFINSPQKLKSSTIGDQLKFANNFKSKIFSVAFKNRSSILPGGYSCDAAFWWNAKTGNWQTSPYYKNVPSWFNKINYKTKVDSFYKKIWSPLLNLNSYINSTTDNQPYEKGLINKSVSTFNYDLSSFVDINYEKIEATPYSIELTFNFAKEIIENEDLGNSPHNVSNMINISISSTDIIGHSYGINSIEMEDTYIRLDKELGKFIEYLDNKLGVDNYLLFLTADHGVSPIPEYLTNNNIKAERLKISSEFKKLEAHLFHKFKIKNLILSFINNQLYLNREAILKAELDYQNVINEIVHFYQNDERILYIFGCRNYSTLPISQDIKDMFSKGYYESLNGDIQVIFKSFVFASEEKQGTTHGTWNSYDTHIPLLWLGYKIKQGHSYKKYFITDIASTVSAILNIEPPSANIGNVIDEIIK